MGSGRAIMTRNLAFIRRVALCAALLCGIGGTALRVRAEMTGKQADERVKLLKGYVLLRPIRFFAGGAAPNVGPLAVKAGATLSDALAETLWTPDADLTQVRISRKEIVNGVAQRVTRTVNFADYIKPAAGKVPDEANNPVIKDNDRIFIGFKAAAPKPKK